MDLVPERLGAWGFASSFVDLDDDGRPDLAISVDYGASRIFWNAGDGTFVDGSEAAGIGGGENAMGSAFGDHDGDSRLDLVRHRDRGPQPGGLLDRRVPLAGHRQPPLPQPRRPRPPTSPTRPACATAAEGGAAPSSTSITTATSTW
ncbi:MAG: VCBS repeat-containing protein [Myxococcales bacterium]|nr:VCBS repeat-containing protein [Myxococcales bacterium]